LMSGAKRESRAVKGAVQQAPVEAKP